MTGIVSPKGGPGAMQQTVQSFEAQAPAPLADRGDLEIDLLSLARTLWLGKVWIALFAAAALAFGYYKAAVVAVPLYTARAEMALEIAAPATLDLQSVVAGFSGDSASLNTEMSVITSGELAGRLVDELRLDLDPEFNPHLPVAPEEPGPVGRALEAVRGTLPEREAVAVDGASPEEVRRDVVSAVRGALATESNWDTYVFGILATSRDPEKAALLANTLAEIYRDDQIRQKVEAAERMATWLSGRVGELRAELDQRQREIADLRARSALVSDESLQALNLQAIELRGLLAEAQERLGEAEERLARLEAAGAAGDIDARLGAAEDGQLAAAAGDLANGEPGARLRFDRRFEQIRLQADSERRRAADQVEELQRQADALTAQFESQSADLLQLQQLEQEAQATTVLYESFLTRLKEASAQSSVHEADSRLLTAAEPGSKVAPRTSFMLALSLVAGLLAGSAFVLLREFRRNGFRTAEDLERLTGQPVLGQIPLIPARNRPDTIRYLLEKPASAAAEAVRNLRTSILLSDLDNPPQVVMATSSIPAEGKTTTAIALALNLAGLGKRVLLIEGDIRRRTFDTYFGNPLSTGGLLSVLTDRMALQEAVTRPDGLEIDVLTGERPTANAADLLSSEGLRRLLEDARAQYDHVIIDTPPVLVVPDARVIGQHADAVIYVVQWDSTARTQVQAGLRAFRSVNVPVAGLVLSRVNPKGMQRYGYGNRYGTYAAYGRNYYEA